MIHQGRLVIFEVPDQHGSRPKRRPVIITSSDEEIATLDVITGVACSHSAVSFIPPRLLGADPLRCTGELRHEASAGDAGDLYVDHTVATRWLSARRYSRSGAQEKAS